MFVLNRTLNYVKCPTLKVQVAKEIDVISLGVLRLLLKEVLSDKQSDMNNVVGSVQKTFDEKVNKGIDSLLCTDTCLLLYFHVRLKVSSVVTYKDRVQTGPS